MASDPSPSPIQPSGDIPCPFCGYDLRVQVAEDARGHRLASRCPECGEAVDHVQIVDRLPLLCERRSPLAAFFLVPLDLLQLLIPRLTLARHAGLAPARRTPVRVLLVALPVWLLSAASLFVFVSILARVTFVGGCDGREDPLTWEAVAKAADYAVNAPDAPTCVLLILSAFLVALAVLLFGLARLRPSGPLGQVQFMRAHAVRRTLYAVSPVFCGLIVTAILSLVHIAFIDVLPDGPEVGPALCCACPLIVVAFLFRLARAGAQDGAARGAGVYVGIGLLSIAAWVAWVAGLGGLLLNKNLAQILHTLNLW